MFPCAKSPIFKLWLSSHIQDCLLSHKVPRPCLNALGMLYHLRLSKEGKKNQSWVVKEPGDSHPSPPRLWLLHTCISLQILGGPTCSRLCQRLHSPPHTRHSVLGLKVVMQAFVYHEQKLWSVTWNQCGAWLTFFLGWEAGGNVPAGLWLLAEKG